MLEVRPAAGSAGSGGAPSERLVMTRADLAKRILRRTTDCGTDVGLRLDPGAVLRHGDIVEGGGVRILIQQAPELVASVRPGGGDPAGMILIGHVIGNRHRPVAVEGGTVFFPIQAESEAGVFSELFAGAGVRAEVGTEVRVFVPHGGADVHGH